MAMTDSQCTVNCFPHTNKRQTTKGKALPTVNNKKKTTDNQRSLLFLVEYVIATAAICVLLNTTTRPPRNTEKRIYNAVSWQKSAQINTVRRLECKFWRELVTIGERVQSVRTHRTSSKSVWIWRRIVIALNCSERLPNSNTAWHDNV